MAEVYDTLEMIAKELTLEAMRQKQVLMPGDRTAELVGERYGKLYKTILKHVREAYEKKYD